ncbi:hypothetical protein AVEN_258251-1 [Araneus ventricosus]|uniref:Reverse transcriptase domain-containing protein n=1 Tax=Araneus ventricosus TaxID=182803 RepID=A0A4Y2M658_ARAVE|nr:hypothetical protein AVEN_258251-1 [Araneus ventricosus]
MNSDSYFIQAFADDLALVSAGRDRNELENNTNNALNMIFDKLKDLELDLSVDKCQGLAFRSNTHYRQRCAQHVFNRYPIVTSMESRFPAMLVLWLGREFYRGKYGLLASAGCGPIPENATLFSISLS